MAVWQNGSKQQLELNQDEFFHSLTSTFFFDRIMSYTLEDRLPNCGEPMKLTLLLRKQELDV